MSKTIKYRQNATEQVASKLIDNDYNVLYTKTSGNKSNEWTNSRNVLEDDGMKNNLCFVIRL